MSPVVWVKTSISINNKKENNVLGIYYKVKLMADKLMYIPNEKTQKLPIL